MLLVYMANNLNGTNGHAVKNELSSHLKSLFSSPEAPGEVGGGSVSLCVLAETFKHVFPFYLHKGLYYIHYIELPFLTQPQIRKFRHISFSLYCVT